MDPETFITVLVYSEHSLVLMASAQGLDPKVIVFKYKKKKHYRRTVGHRQVCI